MSDLATLGRWFDEGIAEGATHMIIRRDWFDGETYPVYAKSRAGAQRKLTEWSDKRGHTTVIDAVIEVYDLRADKAAQMVPFSRVWNLGED